MYIIILEPTERGVGAKGDILPRARTLTQNSLGGGGK